MTGLQAQYLLLYLGYAPGGADGIWGKNSAAACKRFQADYGISASGTLDGDTQKKLIQAVAGTAEKKKSGSFWDDIRYFRRTDPYIACSCGQCGGFPAEPKEKLMRLADSVRTAAGRPMEPTSTVRCAAHNKAVGGVYNSRHLLGQAMDFYIPGMTAAQILALVRQQPEAAYCYAIDSRHVHMDVV